MGSFTTCAIFLISRASEDKVGKKIFDFLCHGSNTTGQVIAFHRSLIRICTPHNLATLAPKSSITILMSVLSKVAETMTVNILTS